MPKVSIADKMRCPFRVQYHKNRLFNPLKVDCFAAQTHSFWNSAKQHTALSYSPHIHLKPSWHIILCPIICGSSVVVQYRKLQNAMRAITQFHGIGGVFFFIQVLCGISIVAPYHILLSIRPTCRHGGENYSWLWQCVARYASDTP